MKKKLKISLWVLLIFVVFAQLKRIDKTNPEMKPEQTFSTVENPPENVINLLHVACFDCHSNTTVYPWYSNVAPFSWWLSSHINHARTKMNLSEWGRLSKKERGEKLEKMAKKIELGYMPISSFKIMHVEARLRDEDKKLLSNWLRSKL